MPRLIRIALTLFASSTILVILVRQRMLQLQEQIDKGVAEDFAKDTTQMIAAGLLLAGVMAAVGFVLVIIAIARSKKRLHSDEG